MLPEVAELVRLRAESDTPKERQEQLLKIMESVSKDHSSKREAVLLNAVDQGLHDPPEWVTIESTYSGHRTHSCERRCTEDQSRARGLLGRRGPTHRRPLGHHPSDGGAPRADLEGREGEARSVQHTAGRTNAFGGAHARALPLRRREDRHSARAYRQRGQRLGADQQLETEHDMAANYGWFRRGSRPMQTIGTRHDKV
jgi:hypothetical protein